MAPTLAEILRVERGYIFRITHRDNVRHLLENGTYCASSEVRDPSFVTIGNEGLIRRRPSRVVPVGPGASLADYVPFYVTPYSPMLYNIKTGYQGVRQRALGEIAILICSLPKLDADGVSYVVSDRHALLRTAAFAVGRENCGGLAWDLWQNRDFRRDLNDPKKFDRYQAEALVHRHLPARTLLGIAVYDEVSEEIVGRAIEVTGAAVRVVRRPEWYP